MNKTIEITAEIYLRGTSEDEAKDVSIIVTLDTDRSIDIGSCQKVVQAFYPLYNISNVRFILIPN